MPFLNNLPDLNLRGLTSSLNPLNFFNDPPPSTPTQPQSPTSSNNNTPLAEAGPGPSSNRTITRRNAPPPLVTAPTSEIGKGPSPMKSSLRPARPTLNTHSSSNDSIDELSGRRKSSGTSVVILDPETDKEKRTRKGSVMNGDGVGETKRKKKAAQDTYIIVKPPPTSSKNPLNLQVQLVVNTGRGRTRTGSSVFSARSPSTGSMIPSAHSSPAKGSIPLPDTDSSSASGTELGTVQSESPTQLTHDEPSATLGAPLARSTSLKSSVSGLSSKSTGTSASGPTASGKRIEPMFNLAVHNVMQPTVVTDAATDTKVAKFLKRHIDVSGVGILEPSEVWLPVPGSDPLNPSLSGSDDGHSPPVGRPSRPLSMVSFNTPLTPTLSRTSEATPGKGKRGSIDIKNDIKNFRDSILNQTMTSSPDAPAKKFFGKLFKKKEVVDVSSNKSVHRKSISEVVIEPSSPRLDAVTNSAPTTSVRAAVTEHFAFVGHSTFGTAPSVVHRRSSDPTINPDGAVTGLTLPSAGPAISLSTSASSDRTDYGTPYPMTPSTRPIGYTWTVRKWAKKNSENWAQQLVSASAAGLDARMDDDVVFEWVKMKSPASLSRMTTRNTIASRRGTLDVAADSPLHSATSLALPRPASTIPPPSPNLDARPKGVRTISTRSSPTRPATPVDDSSTIHTLDDEAYDSDPEDSETPWTCSVWIKKTNRRQLLGTLTPAPHHPKVIGILKLPVGLQAIPLCEIVSKPMPAEINGNADKAVKQKEAEKRVHAEVCITEEGLKDIICVSAMWLVAREEFGGLGRKKKA